MKINIPYYITVKEKRKRTIKIGCLAAYRRAAGKFAGERSARGEREHALAVRHAGDERAGVRSVLHAPEERGAAGNIFPLAGEKALGGERSLKPPAVAQHGAGISALGKRATGLSVEATPLAASSTRAAVDGDWQGVTSVALKMGDAVKCYPGYYMRQMY